MTKEELPKNKDEKEEIIRPIKPGDIEFITLTKPMTMREVLEEMKKQGRRGLTIEELTSLVEKSKSQRIEPKDTDIIIESGKPKKLTE